MITDKMIEEWIDVGYAAGRLCGIGVRLDGTIMRLLVDTSTGEYTMTWGQTYECIGVDVVLTAMKHFRNVTVKNEKKIIRVTSQEELLQRIQEYYTELTGEWSPEKDAYVPWQGGIEVKC
jgi:hypothetical protein